MSKIFRWQWICRYGELWRTSVISDRASEFLSEATVQLYRLVGAQGGRILPEVSESTAATVVRTLFGVKLPRNAHR
jgi:hypothetical protein